MQWATFKTYARKAPLFLSVAVLAFVAQNVAAGLVTLYLEMSPSDWVAENMGPGLGTLTSLLTNPLTAAVAALFASWLFFWWYYRSTHKNKAVTEAVVPEQQMEHIDKPKVPDRRRQQDAPPVPPPKKPKPSHEQPGKGEPIPVAEFKDPWWEKKSTSKQIKDVSKGPPRDRP